MSRPIVCSIFTARARTLLSQHVHALSEGENLALVEDQTTNNLANSQKDAHINLQDEHHSDESEKPTVNQSTGQYVCSSCHVSFDSSETLRSHSKSAWHVANVQLITKGLQPHIDEQSYNQSLNQPPKQTIKQSSNQSINQSNDRDSDVDEDDSDLADQFTNQSISDDEDDQTTKASSPLITCHSTNQSIKVVKNLIVNPKLINQSSYQFSDRASQYVTALRSFMQSTHQSNNQSNDRRLITVILCMGGRFSGAIFDPSMDQSIFQAINQSMVHHRSFVRYTVRAGQGGSQAANDAANSSHKAVSAGSTIRRQQMTRFTEQCHEFLADYHQPISQSISVFLYAPSFNRKIFFQPVMRQVEQVKANQSINQSNSSAQTFKQAINVAFDKSDTRIRSIPFTISRPTTSECQRVYQAITQIEIIEPSIYPTPEAAQQAIEQSKQSNKQTSTNQSNKQTNDRSNNQSVQPELVIDPRIEAIKEGDLNKLIELLDQPEQSNNQSNNQTMPVVYAAVKYKQHEILEYLLDQRKMSANVSFLENILNQSIYWSALHLACHQSNNQSINQLLKSGADPTVEDSRNWVPYRCIPAGDTGTKSRQCVREFAGQNEDLFDWQSVGVVPIKQLSQEEMEEKKAAQKAKDKAKKQRQKANKQANKQAEEVEQAAQRAREQEEAKTRDARRAQAEVTAKGAAAIEQAFQARQAQISSLSDREKRALAAEQRLKAAKGDAVKCAHCRKQIVRVPFERLQYKYCSLDCLTRHRLALEAVGMR